MKFTVIIPARYQSSRLPAKPILNIAGKPMIQWVWEKACESGATQVVIATDNDEIKAVSESFGATVCMTLDTHQSGTDRLAEVVHKLNLNDDEIIVNVQGDEPLIPSENISQVASLLNNSDAPMSTLSTSITDINEVNDPNAVKVISDDNSFAIYFSRAPIPFDRDGELDSPESLSKNYQRHVGIYAYRCGFLKQFAAWDMSSLEKIEKLEQLRVLSRGYKIKVAEARSFPEAGIDTEEDLERVRNFIQKRL